MQLFEVSSHTVAPSDRLAFFQDQAVGRYMDMQVEPVGDAAFFGYSRGLRFGPVGIGVVSGSPLALIRNARQAARQRPEAVYFDMMLHGNLTVEQEGVSRTVAQQSCVVSDANRPYVNILDAADERPHMLTLGVPAHLLPRRYAMPGWGLETHDLTIGPGKVLANTITSALNELDYLGPSERISIGNLIVDLIRAATGAAPEAPVRHSAKFAQVQAYAGVHFADETLAADGLARAVGLSERSLRRLLAAHDTTLRDLLRQVRTEEARRRLLSAEYRGVTAAEVLLGCGFGDINSAGRALKAAFGMSAGEIRRMADKRAP
jgi:AraC-like DNA-binding protein